MYINDALAISNQLMSWPPCNSLQCGRYPCNCSIVFSLVRTVPYWFWVLQRIRMPLMLRQLVRELDWLMHERYFLMAIINIVTRSSSFVGSLVSINSQCGILSPSCSMLFWIIYIISRPYLRFKDCHSCGVDFV